MYGSAIENTAVEHQRYLLDEAAGRHLLAAGRREDAPRRRRVPAFALWRAVVALLRSP